MSHEDVIVGIEDDVTCVGQSVERGAGFCVTREVGRSTGLSERRVDGEPQILVVHLISMPRFLRRRLMPS